MRPRPGHKPFYSHLYVQVLVAIAIGVGLRLFLPGAAAQMKPLGDGFIKLIKMMIAPIIFTTVVVGIAKMGDMKEVGRVGLKALIYFEAVSTLALAIGLVVVNVVRPGDGINADVSTLDTKSIASYAVGREVALHGGPAAAHHPRLGGGRVRRRARSSRYCCSRSCSASRWPARATWGRPLVDLIDRLSHVALRRDRDHHAGRADRRLRRDGVHRRQVRGRHALLSLGKLMACVYATCFLFVFVVLGAIARLTGFSLWQFLRYIKEEILIVLGTSSSEAALPRMITKLENVGCARPVVGLVIPTGYSFNLDGTSIYLTMAAIFIAQATNVPLSLGQQLSILGVLLLTSKGAAAVTGGGFITLAATLSTTGHGPRGGPGAAARDRPVHVGGAGDHQPDRQRRGDDGDRPLGRGARPGADADAVLAGETDAMSDDPETLADTRTVFSLQAAERKVRVQRRAGRSHRAAIGRSQGKPVPSAPYRGMARRSRVSRRARMGRPASPGPSSRGGSRRGRGAGRGPARSGRRRGCGSRLQWLGAPSSWPGPTRSGPPRPRPLSPVDW